MLTLPLQEPDLQKLRGVGDAAKLGVVGRIISVAQTGDAAVQLSFDSEKSGGWD
jgi:hypothetical protein